LSINQWLDYTGSGVYVNSDKSIPVPRL